MWLKHADVVPASLKQRALQELLINNIGIEKTRLLARDSIYWITINAVSKMPHVWNSRPLRQRTCQYYMTYQASHGKCRCKHIYILVYCRLPQLIHIHEVLTASLKHVRLYLQKTSLQRKIMPDLGTNFASEKFKEFCRH